MSFLVVVVVTALVVIYVRSSRRQRAQWLQKLDLIGRWETENGDETLTLSGQLDEGRFVRVRGTTQLSGEWRLSGHNLHLESGGSTEVYDLRLFQPGCIGLKDSAGLGTMYEKAGDDNVVDLGEARRARD